MPKNETTAKTEGKSWDYDRIRARCHELCELPDGSPCEGPESDCTPENCSAMRQAAVEFGYAFSVCRIGEDGR